VRRSREQGHILQLESELPNLADGNMDTWQEYFEREMDVNPRWVWNVDLKGLLMQAKELCEGIKQGRKSATDV
jgi:salicylate hydroxylase